MYSMHSYVKMQYRVGYALYILMDNRHFFNKSDMKYKICVIQASVRIYVKMEIKLHFLT